MFVNCYKFFNAVFMLKMYCRFLFIFLGSEVVHFLDTIILLKIFVVDFYNSYKIKILQNLQDKSEIRLFEKSDIKEKEPLENELKNRTLWIVIETLLLNLIHLFQNSDNYITCLPVILHFLLGLLLTFVSRSYGCNENQKLCCAVPFLIFFLAKDFIVFKNLLFISNPISLYFILF